MPWTQPAPLPHRQGDGIVTTNGAYVQSAFNGTWAMGHTSPSCAHSTVSKKRIQQLYDHALGAGAGLCLP